MARGSSMHAAAKKKNYNHCNKASPPRSGGASKGPPRDVVPIDQVLATNTALRDHLCSLGATRPSYVIEKHLQMSDVHRNQARLLFSCKSGSRALCPLAACFTELEARRVGDDEGLLVTALDRGGRSYDLRCKYLDSNHGYRFITGWKDFLAANGLLLDMDDEGGFQRDVHAELWAFRSRELPNRFGKKENIREETGHPDGALGLVLLHYEYDREEEEMVDDEPMMPAAAPLLVGAGIEQPDVAAAACSMTKDEIVAKFGEKMALAAIGMDMLRRRSWARDCMDTPQFPFKHNGTKEEKRLLESKNI